MGRELDKKDIDIMKKLVPEIAGFVESGRMKIEYMNILPPVANHYSRGANDFDRRLQNLSSEDVKYLADKIIDGSESVSRLSLDYAEVFFTYVGRSLTEGVADELREIYETG
jgi:hypothetical protein